MSILGVIVNYRTPKLAIEAVRSLRADFDGLDASVEVVDNDSDDGSFEALSQAIAQNGWGDRVRVTAAGRNGGFGFGNNVAMARALASEAPPDYILLLNPDATIRPGSTRALLAFMEAHPQVGIAGTRIFYLDGAPSTSTFRFPSLASELEEGLSLGPASRLLRAWSVPIPPPGRTCEVDWVSGTSMMIRRQALERAGLFDEDFFLYFEEIDLCRRVREAGLAIYHVHEAVIDHVERASTGLADDRPLPPYWFESRRRYFQKNHGTPYFLAATLCRAVGLATNRVRRFVDPRPGRDPPRMLRDMVRHALIGLPPRQKT